MDRNYVKNLLEELLNIYSPTGDTENEICFMEKKFKELNIPWDVYKRQINNWPYYTNYYVRN